MSADDLGEERANLYQRIGELERRIAAMELRLTDEGLNVISLRCAKLVEDQFVMHHEGGRAQRLAKVQTIIREVLCEIATGKRAWDAWFPGSTGPEPRTTR